MINQKRKTEIPENMKKKSSQRNSRKEEENDNIEDLKRKLRVCMCDVIQTRSPIIWV